MVASEPLAWVLGAPGTCPEKEKSRQKLAAFHELAQEVTSSYLLALGSYTCLPSFKGKEHRPLPSATNIML